MSIGGGQFRADGRSPGQLRTVKFALDVQKWAEGSCTIEMGDTRVLCAATVEDRVPPHLRGKGLGWVTAEYSMLPRATNERMQREVSKGRQGGRTMAIQRLIGRALRGVVDTARVGAAWTRRRSVTGRARSTATSCRPTAAHAPRPSLVATSRSLSRCARSA